MATRRTAFVGASIVLAILMAGACGQVNGLVTGRDLVCEGTPDDVCIRVADQVANDDHVLGPIAKVRVTARECLDGEGPRAVRCWHVEAETRPDAGGRFGRLGGQWYQRVDGTLFGDIGAGVECPCPE